jgi:hypothetical protein
VRSFTALPCMETMRPDSRNMSQMSMAASMSPPGLERRSSRRALGLSAETVSRVLLQIFDGGATEVGDANAGDAAVVGR